MNTKRFRKKSGLKTKLIIKKLFRLNKSKNFLESKIRARTEQLAKLCEKLRAAEEGLTRVFDANPHIMYVIAKDHRRYILVNDAFIKVSGYRRTEIIGKTVNDFCLFGSQEWEEIVAMLDREEVVRDLEVRFTVQTDNAREGLMSIENIDISGEACCLFIIVDVTERKRFDFAQELAHLDRLNLVGQMAASIGHEIRNPMTTTRGFLQLLQSKADYRQHQDHFSLMIEELDRANGIITEFLSLAKDKRMKKTRQNLKVVVETLKTLIDANATLAGKHIVYDLQACPDFMFDESEIRQMLLNLVQNGLEAMEAGGMLQIMLYNEESDIVFAVKDQGSGINPGILDKLGTPFFTTKEQGTGLGLAVCYSIAARHNAHIEVETDHKGTTFFIRFRKSNRMFSVQ